MTCRCSSTSLWEVAPTSASEDFGSFGTGWHAPNVFWFIGGTDPDEYAKAKEAGRLSELLC
jgi:hippurate hydrolase